jgi:hypothetical protein
VANPLLPLKYRVHFAPLKRLNSKRLKLLKVAKTPQPKGLLGNIQLCSYWKAVSGFYPGTAFLVFV